MTSPIPRPNNERIDAVLIEALKRHKKMPRFFCRQLKFRRRAEMTIRQRRFAGVKGGDINA